MPASLAFQPKANGQAFAGPGDFWPCKVNGRKSETKCHLNWYRGQKMYLLWNQSTQVIMFSLFACLWILLSLQINCNYKQNPTVLVQEIGRHCTVKWLIPCCLCNEWFSFILKWRSWFSDLLENHAAADWQEGEQGLFPKQCSNLLHSIQFELIFLLNTE